MRKLDELHTLPDFARLYAALRETDSLGPEWADTLGEHLNRPIRVLDIGSGTGTLAAQIRAFGCDYLGIEPTPTYFRRAVERYPNECFILGRFPNDLCSLGDWDLAILHHNVLLELLNEMSGEDIAAGLARCLKRGGVVLCDYVVLAELQAGNEWLEVDRCDVGGGERISYSIRIAQASGHEYCGMTKLTCESISGRRRVKYAPLMCQVLPLPTVLATFEYAGCSIERVRPCTTRSFYPGTMHLIEMRVGRG